ncbi:MAG: hypothetical protein EB060_08880 [Proteobacteria bacterium]|nr:hypothetical protein [Pseudomonadota bacterium]
MAITLTPVIHDAEQIGKEEMLLLLNMMKRLYSPSLATPDNPDAAIHDALKGAIKAYGYIPPADATLHDDKPFVGGTWDEVQYAKYKTETLKGRMEGKAGYTFILAKDEAGKTVGIASFNAPAERPKEGEYELRFLNLVVAPEASRTPALEMLVGAVINHAYEKGYDKLVAPLGQYAIAHDRPGLYKKAAAVYGFDYDARPHRTSKGDVEIFVTPREVLQSLGAVAARTQGKAEGVDKT